jgi:hypothetical protein
MDEESTGGMVIPPRIISSSTKNLPEEWIICRELSAQGNPPEKGDSAGNNQLMEADSYRQDQIERKILQTVTISG